MAKESIKGIPEVIKELRAIGKDMEKLIDVETSGIAEQIARDAKVGAPVNFGDLKGSIGAEKIKESNYRIFVNMEYGAYIEFGTGAKVRVPADFDAIAKQFRQKRPGTFEEAIRSIEEWLKKKGGDPKDAKWVLIKILKAGINPQPFLHPAWVKGKKDYLNNLKKLLKKYNKKI